MLVRVGCQIAVHAIQVGRQQIVGASEIGRSAALAELDAHFDEESARGERPEGLGRSAVGRNERGSRCREMTVARAVVEDGPGGTALVHRVEDRVAFRSEEQPSELQSLMSHSYAVFCLKKKELIHIIIIYI